MEHPDTQVGRSPTPRHDPQPSNEITTTAKARRWIEAKDRAPYRQLERALDDRQQLELALALHKRA